MTDKSIMVIHESPARKQSDFEHLDTITGRFPEPEPLLRAREGGEKGWAVPFSPSPPPRPSLPQTYIKGSHFRG